MNIEVTANILTTGVPSPWIDVEDYASFITAIDAIGATERTLLIASEKAVADDKTVPSNVTLKFLQGGSLNIANTKTVTINGHVEAELYQIFKGAGSVVFGLGAVEGVHPHWWGAVGDEVADDTAEIQACLDSLTSGGIVFIPSNFKALLTNKLTINYSNITIWGHGKSSKLTMHSGEAYDYSIIYATGKNNIVIWGLYFYGNKDTNAAWGTNFAGAIEFDDVTDFSIEGCFGENMTGGKAAIFLAGGCKKGIVAQNRLLTLESSGITAYGDSGGAPENLKIINNFIKDTDSKNGIFILGGDVAADPPPVDILIQGNTIKNQFDVGIEVNGGSSTNGAQRAKIIGNDCDGGHQGILVRKCSQSIVANNHCLNSDQDNGILIGWDTPYSEEVIVIGNICENNTLDGIRLHHASNCIVMGNHCDNNGEYGIKEMTGNADHNLIVGNWVKNNTSGAIEVVDVASNTKCYHNLTDDSVDIASAATITLPQDGDYFNITGTVNITSVAASWAGRKVTLKFAAILTFTDGSNLKIAGNFVTSADDTICLVSDGVNWYEAGARSVN